MDEAPTSAGLVDAPAGVPPLGVDGPHRRVAVHHSGTLADVLERQQPPRRSETPPRLGRDGNRIELMQMMPGSLQEEAAARLGAKVAGL